MTQSKAPPRIRLSTAFVAAAIAVALLVAGLAVVIFHGWRRSILDGSQTLRDETAKRIALRVESELSVSGEVVDAIARGMRLGALPVDDWQRLESELFTLMLERPSLAEIAFTHAQRTGFQANGDPIFAPEGRWQLSLRRATVDPKSPLITRFVHASGSTFVAEERERRSADDGLLAAAFTPKGEAEDPTLHATFEVPASKPFGDADTVRPLASDLHWSEMDQKLPPEQRRVAVSVQESVLGADHVFLGVVRVGATTDQVDRIVRGDEAARDPDVRVFLCDDHGGLLTRLAPDDPLVVRGDDLRIVPKSLPADVAAVTKLPVLATLSKAHADEGGVVEADGRRSLWTAHLLDGTQRWIAVVVVPESHYTAPLARSIRAVTIVAVAILVLLVILGAGTLRAVRRGLGEVVNRTRRMRDLDFRAQPVDARYADVHEAIDSLERAKTVVRALGRYVPIDLVRRLFAQNADPTLGGELRDLSILFTDIEGFTTLSETLEPDALAEALGRYLQAMTDAIEKERGVIDKYVGDAVMALWNAPGEVEDHPAHACRAALACIEATSALFASEAWKGLPALHTRFGIHHANVMVGHFGAPTRLSYTAIGDGVNLAARLEGLCKQYGVTILVSQSIVDAVGDRFAFRKLDVVAVKGKKKGIEVYELLGEKERSRVAHETVKDYEAALAAYLRRAFDDARSILEKHPHDAPSRALAERCAILKESPPPEDWDGVWIARSK